MKQQKLILILLAVLMIVALVACEPETTSNTVTFVFGEGFDDTAITVDNGLTVTEPTAPTKDGYTLTGWYKDEAKTQAWDFATDTVTADITLYANWEKVDPTLGYETITVAQALEIINGLEAGVTTTERYYLRGTIKITDDQYGKLDLTDETGTITVYGSYSADGETRWSSMTDKPSTGDTVLIYGNLQNYKGNTPEVYSGWIIAYNAAEKVEVVLPAAGSEITIAQAIEIAKSLNSGETTERYFLRGTIENITNPNYGEMYLTDGEGNSIYVYGCYSADGTIQYPNLEDKPYKGDIVYVSALIQLYKGEPELKSVWIQSFEKVEVEVNEDDYVEMTIAAAREAAEDAYVKVSGTVARITYANGKIPSGFILIDGTSSIYVYDGQIAPRVEVGNTVTILGQKTWWILSTEESNAQKFGYKGCCQLENVVLKENNEQVSDFDVSWIESTTIKDIVETPCTTDISSLVFKVNAYITKSVTEGAGGFTNYYFNDLDGKTGSYAYTQCNGADYDWLDEFVGKICTVYITPLNAKSTTTGCAWRFVPVKVIDENFVFDMDNVGKFIVDYYALGQFVETYAADPELELITSVDSELLGFNGATISYASDNTSVVYIENGVLHTGSAGKATVTITGSYDSYKSYTTTLEISVVSGDSYDYITVAQAIAAELTSVSEQQVTVKGIVGPSLVNQAGGFYLIDETGVIAVKFNTSTDIDKIALGNEIIITGNRDAYGVDGNKPGQVCITGATLVVNLYGTHDYCTDTFITDKTFDYLYDLAQDTTVDHTTEVYVLQAKITFSGYTCNIVNPDNGVQYLSIYASGVAQSDWLKAYEGQDVTIEVALCNWNKKPVYKVCVLAVHLKDGTVIYNELNFNS